MENALSKRRRMGKKVAVAGLCMSLAACGGGASQSDNSMENNGSWNETYSDNDTAMMGKKVDLMIQQST